MEKSLRIMTWNANGLTKHLNELELVLQIEKVDVCLISETHLTTHTFAKMKNYSTYYTNHPLNNARGGSAILVKNSIRHIEKEKVCLEEFQSTSIAINAETNELCLTAVYSPPRHNIKSEQYKHLLQKHMGRLIIGGDFNAKHVHWGSRLTTTKGRELYKAARETGCEFISTGKPTYWPTDQNKTPDLIDFFIVRKICKKTLQVYEGTDLSSDHSPVYLKLSEGIELKQQAPTLTNKFTDWEYFKNKLNQNVEQQNTLTSYNEIDEEVLLLTQQIQNAAWYSTLTQTVKQVGLRYPNEIFSLIAEKRKLRKKWQRTRQPSLKTMLNKMTQHLREEMNKLKNSFFNHYIKGLTAEKTTDYSLWKSTKYLKRPTIQNPPIKKPNGLWAKNDIEKTEVFADHLEKTFKPHEAHHVPLLTDIHQAENHFSLSSLAEIKREINILKSKKTPGFDLITAETLKHLPQKTLIKLTKIINACLKLKYMPTYWKVSEVIMIPKPGKSPHEVSSYRPISLLPIMSKLFEKIILKRLKPLIENKHLIPTHQFGFRAKHSTIEQVHRITNVIEEAIEKKKVCSSIFLDVAQAFDKVWHDGLLHKLKILLPREFSDIFTSYLNNRYFRIKCDSSYSSLKPIKAGVPQGSILGPILYVLFTADLPVSGTSTTATFADDTCILAIGDNETQSTGKLQEDVNKITEWTTKWRIKLNEAKSLHVDFTNKKIQYRPIYISGMQIPYSNTAKYLGMTLDAKLCWKEHVKIKHAELNLKMQKLNWLTGRSSPLSIQNKLLIYKQVFKPVWTYGIQLWGCAKQTHIEKIQRFQNKFLKSAVNAPWYVRKSDLHRDLKMSSVSEVVKQYAAAHTERLEKHTNPEARQLANPDEQCRRLKRKKPNDLVPEIVTAGKQM